MSIRSNKTDIAWDKLFNKYNILNEIEKDNVFKISAAQINEFREARLMTKFDHSIHLPILFKKHKLRILPDTRGTYIIGKFKAYENLKVEEMKPIPKVIPDFIQTFDSLDITSESTALNIAHMSGMIDDVLNTKATEPSSILTLSGRMGVGNINYKIRTNDNLIYDFRVNKSQIEIDGSYENLNEIAIIEAKNKIPADFLIRQLYYPYRYYNNLGVNKSIKPIFFTYADDIFSFHTFKFENINEYTSIKRVNQLNFILNDTLDLNLEEVKKISYNSLQVEEPHHVPFPQADNFTRILDMIGYLTKYRNKWELAGVYDFDVRQSDYYANALVYLEMATKNNNGEFRLNDLGFKINKMRNSNRRNHIIIEKILKHKSFNLAFDSVLKNHGEFDKEYISKVLLENVPTIKKISTAKRRTNTVCSWINWMLSVID